jgi:hypothetical protein
MTEPQPVVSTAAQEMYDAIKQWHPNDADYGWPGLYFCEAVCGGGLQTLISIARDAAAGQPGWSVLLDLARCPDADLAFLAQFRGVAIPSGVVGQAARDLILTQPAGARGRPATLVAAVRATLTGSQFCVLTERDTSAYHATIEVFRNQMPDQNATLKAIADNKPAGIIVALNIHDGPTYAQVRTALPANTYGDRQDTFPTYGDVEDYIP